MKKLFSIIVLSSVALCLGFCQGNYSKLHSIVDSELKKGNYNDTLFSVFCRGDAPAVVQSKLNSLLSSGALTKDSAHGKFIYYNFKSENAINTDEWKFAAYFINDSLAGIDLMQA